MQDFLAEIKAEMLLIQGDEKARNILFYVLIEWWRFEWITAFD